MTRSPLRWSFVALSLAAGGLALTVPDSATARPGSRAKKPVVSALTRARGAKRPSTLGVQPGKAWKGSPTLSVAASKLALAAVGLPPAPGTVVAQVSPAHPLHDGVMALMLVRPEITNPIENYTVFPVAPTGGQSLSNLEQKSFGGLWLKSDAPGAKYLVDCAVSVEGGAGPVSALMVAFDGGKKASFQLPAGQQHVTWVLDSPDAKWHSFRLGSRARWTLHSCEATRM